MTLALRPPPRTRFGVLAERIDAATPAHRDRAVDALRAVAILGVVIGHWAVTALVAGGPEPGGADAARLHGASPLSAMPAFIPVSWALQTLAVFFFVGGYAGAKSLRRPYGEWIRVRMLRLFRPVAVLLLAWVPLTLVLVSAGVPPVPLLKLVLSPLWFLCAYAALTALTPLLRGVKPYAAIAPALVVAMVDLGRFGTGGPDWLDRLGWLNVLAGWLVPYILGMAWAEGALGSRRTAAVLLVAGVTGTVALVAWGGYPGSMVGVPGAAISNLNPPTLAAVTFGVGQVGLALLVRDRLARCMRRPVAWAAVAMANLSAMTVFCWHQTAMMLVTLAGLGAGTMPGLHDAPDDPMWALHRLAWLPAFAVTLIALWAAFHRFERPARSRSQARSQH